MAISASNLTTAGSASSSTSHVTASVSPGANKLLIIAVTTENFVVTSVSGFGLTWNFLNSRDQGTINTRAYYAITSSSPPASGSVTLSTNGSCNASWSLVELTGVDLLNPIIQSAVNGVTSNNTGITVTLSAFGDANNGTFGVVGHDLNSVAITPGSGFAEVGEAAATGSTRIETEFKASSDTSVDWTWSSAVTAAALAAEIGQTTTSTTTSTTSTSTSSTTSTSTTTTSTSTTTTSTSTTTTSTSTTTTSTSTTTTSTSTTTTSTSSSSTTSSSTSTTTTAALVFSVEDIEYSFAVDHPGE